MHRSHKIQFVSILFFLLLLPFEKLRCQTFGIPEIIGELSRPSFPAPKGQFESVMDVSYEAVDYFGEWNVVTGSEDTTTWFYDSLNRIIAVHESSFQKRNREIWDVKYNIAHPHYEVSYRKGNDYYLEKIEACAKGDKFKEFISYRNDTIVQREISTYDHRDSLLESKWWREDLTPGSSELRKWDKYEYDTKGNQTRWWSWTPASGVTDLHYTFKNNKIAESREYDEGNAEKRRTCFSYDQLGRLRTEMVVQEYKRDYTYDARGNCIGIVFCDWDEDSNAWVATWKQRESFDGSGNVKTREIISDGVRYYDEYLLLGGVSIGVKHVRPDQMEETTFELDHTGNWIKRIVTITSMPEGFFQSRETTITERSINYR